MAVEKQDPNSLPPRKTPYSFGGGLMLQKLSDTSASWLYRYQLNGKERRLGLGSLQDVTLAAAKKKRDKARVMVRDGVNIVAEARSEKHRAKIETAKGRTFKDYAESYLRDRFPPESVHAEDGPNAKHVQQWQNTLKTYAYPHLGSMVIGQIDTASVLKCLRPIWTTKRETANRVRGRIEAILNAARVEGLCEGENPARWRGHLDQVLERRRKRDVKHHAALPFADLPAFMADLRKAEGDGARALELTILTAARTGEVIYATPEEFDLKQLIWTVPASHMKGKREHRVPLTDRAVMIVRTMLDRLPADAPYLFPGGRDGAPLSNAAMPAVLKRMNRSEITVHGFRSTFRDWAAEETHYPRDVIEMALAHTIESDVEAAYRRGDLFEKRRKLMADWAAYCDGPRGENVVALRRT